MKKHCGRYTSTKTGITMGFKRWLECICQVEFKTELCMTAPSLWAGVVERFDQYVAEGVLVPVL